MTLIELVHRYRQHLEDETVGVRRSWEETFKYTLRFYPGHTPLEEFDLRVLEVKMTADGINRQFVEGYVRRWRGLLPKAAQL